MKTHSPATAPSCGGFTLVELLVVIGVMAVVATIVGVGLSRGSDGTSLVAAQNIVISQLAAGRAQAALSGENAAFVVVDDANSIDDSRRVVGVALQDDEGWRLVSDPVRLPGTVGVVDVQADSTLWRSIQAVALDVGPETTQCRALEIAPNGSLDSAGGGEIWLAIGQQSAGGWQSTNDAPRRGVRVSRYGAVQPIGESSILE